jgi:hypothetical protein
MLDCLNDQPTIPGIQTLYLIASFIVRNPDTAQQQETITAWQKVDLADNPENQ